MNKLRFKLEFNYELMDNVNSVIIEDQIINKSFTINKVTYQVIIDEELIDNIILLLKIVTYNQIKIFDLNQDDDIDIPKGTDKPLGSKDAIDEN